MIARLKAWARRKLFETPPEVVRKPDPMAAYREKWSELRQAYRRSDLEGVRRLTAECRDLKREMGGQ